MSSFTVLIIVITLFAIVAGARVVTPADNKQGISFDNQTNKPFKQSTFEVATFNVQTGKNLQGKRNINRAARVISSVDIVGVQEVYGAGWLNKLGIGQSQTESLSNNGKLSHLFAATRWRWFREQRGNATFSRIPIERWQIIMLPDQSRKSPRNMTIAHFLWQGESIAFINTHLHTGRGREQQIDAVIEKFKRYPKAILVGDFNTQRSDPALRPLLDDPDITDAITAAKLDEQGEQRIDWIFTKGLSVKQGKQLPKGISDHPFFAVTLY